MSIEQQADILFDNVAGWETSTLQRIGKRINQYGKMSISDVQAMNNIAVVKQDMREITKELARVTVFNASQIEDMYAELLAEQHLLNKPLYDYRNKPFVPLAENRELQAIVNAYARATANEMINLSKTSALKMIDETGKVLPFEKAYKNTLDKAVMQVSTGATDFHTAMRNSIRALGGNGIRVQYESGATRRLDSAVRQNLLWGAKQASIEYNDLIGQELECDGYEVDAHSNPRPSHMFMQGVQYCIGKSRRINGIDFVGFEETDPSSPDGLSASKALDDYGCLHYKTPIICGVSEPRFTKQELEKIKIDNLKEYNVDNLIGNKYFFSQKMRNLETAIREQKSIRNMAKVSGDKQLVKQCNENITAYNEKYNKISEITGLHPDKKRLSVIKP